MEEIVKFDAKLILRLLLSSGEVNIFPINRPLAEKSAVYIAAELTAIQNTAAAIQDAQYQRAILLERHAKEIADADRVVAKAQSQCKHLVTTHHRDPSGGSDSHSTCDVCGMQVP
jgi:hypothetical protein